MPLAWAHTEYLKLLRSLSDGRVFDMPPQPVQRYQVEKIESPWLIWRFNHKLRSLPAGQIAPHYSVQGELLFSYTLDQKTENKAR